MPPEALILENVPGLAHNGRFAEFSYGVTAAGYQIVAIRSTTCLSRGQKRFYDGFEQPHRMVVTVHLDFRGDKYFNRRGFLQYMAAVSDIPRCRSACDRVGENTPKFGDTPFTGGASGDPEPDGVDIWT